VDEIYEFMSIIGRKMYGGFSRILTLPYAADASCLANWEYSGGSEKWCTYNIQVSIMPKCT